MRGRIITSDHRIFELPVLLRWNITYTGGVPCDSYEVTCVYDRTMAELLHLAIARAIAKDPKIFIFDDSFSALDLKTDAALRKALAENVKDSTVIIVAQRISTILHAEQILVLDDGKVVGKGTHEGLLRSCEVYQEIAKSQLSEKELGLKESEVADHE